MYSTNANQYVRSCHYLFSCESVISVSDTNNQALSLILITTNPNNQTVRCNQQLEGFGSFECEFCYGPGASCQDLATCITANNSATSLTPLTEVTYCYRATARVNGIPVAVIQDTFGTGKSGTMKE